MSEPGTDGAGPGIVDAHLHLWDLTTGDYTWNTPALGAAHASFGPADAAAVLASARVERAVLVQAADTVGDSERMFAAAARHPWVAGVVAWIPLEDPRRARGLLDRWTDTGRLSGIRQLLHDHPDPDLLDAPAVRATLATVAERGLPLDLPDAWPRLWPAVTRLVEEMPELVVVLDHLGKPPLGLGVGGRSTADAEFRRWERSVDDLGEHPSVVAKLSGLDAVLGSSVPLDAETIAPLVDTALRAFGPDRLMFGGDWPMSLARTSYANLVTAMQAVLAGLDVGTRTAVLHRTAEQVYGLVRRIPGPS